jgi:hypothetical protein
MSREAYYLVMAERAAALAGRLGGMSRASLEQAAASWRMLAEMERNSLLPAWAGPSREVIVPDRDAAARSELFDVKSVPGNRPECAAGPGSRRTAPSPASPASSGERTPRLREQRLRLTP